MNSPDLVPSWFMQERFDSNKNMPIVKRLNKIAKDVESNISIYYHYSITSEERREIKTAVKKMFKFSTLRSLYKDFYAWIEKPQLCKFGKQSTFEYSDVFPLIYLKMHWTGIKTFDNVKHLLVDEMQDYTPVQYAIIAKLFPCKKTILGDANQSVNPFSSSSSHEIQKVFHNSDCVKLCKSYRSTFEITQFAQAISPNADLEAVERHGEAPELICLKSQQDEFDRTARLVHEFNNSDYHSMGIICKTDRQAKNMYQYLKNQNLRVFLVSSESQVFRQGIIICTAHMAKGLEFDSVIVPEATEENYASEVDKSMLYIACTRAMHRLSLTYETNLTKFINPS